MAANAVSRDIAAVAARCGVSVERLGSCLIELILKTSPSRKPKYMRIDHYGCRDISKCLVSQGLASTYKSRDTIYITKYGLRFLRVMFYEGLLSDKDHRALMEHVFLRLKLGIRV